MDVQAYDATLDAFAAYDTDGLLTQTASGTFTGRTITGTANQVLVTNGNGVAGNPTLSLPQSIDTGAAVAFGSLDLGSTTLLASRALTIDTGGVFDINLGTAAGDDFTVDTSALVVEGDTGRVGIGTATPGALLDVGAAGATLGVIRLAGDTSGNVTLQPAAAAGTWTLTLPTAGGSANQFLQTDGAGVTTWADALVSGAALTKTDDTNVTLTLGGSPSTALVNAASVTAGWTGELLLARGGTGANLTASNGGILYSTGTAAAILAGTATAGQLLLSGASSAPSWSTATYPAAAGTSGNVLTSDGTNWTSGVPGGVTSLTGTVNQVNVSASTGAVTLSTPQDIDTAATVAFTSADLGGTTLLASRALTVDTGGVFDINLGTASGDDFTVDTSAFVVEGDTGNIGIGTATPDAGFHLDQRITRTDTSGTLYGSYFESIFAPSSASSAATVANVNHLILAGTANLTGVLSGATSQITNVHTGTVADVRGLSLNFINFAASGTITSGTGALLFVDNSSTGSVGTIRGAWPSARNTGGGAVTNSYGLYSETINSSGTMTTAYGVEIINTNAGGTQTDFYGVHVGDVTSGTQTNTPYSFYASDPGALNYFAGTTAIGTEAFPSAGTVGLIFADGTALSGMGTDTAGLYADDVATTTELFAIDEAGNATQISPHGFELFTPAAEEVYPHSYSSKNAYLGVEINIDMIGAIRAIEELTGRQFIHTRELPASERRDWKTDQDVHYTQAAAAVDAWEQDRLAFEAEHAAWVAAQGDEATEPTFDKPRLGDPERVAPPDWLAERLRRLGRWDGSIVNVSATAMPDAPAPRP